jgi:hypothetical protein
MSVAIAKNTAIHITSYSRKSFSKEENEILKRFAKVFEQHIPAFSISKAEANAKRSTDRSCIGRVRSKADGYAQS